MGCDASTLRACRTCFCFNSRTPCGVRPMVMRRVLSELVFQFTHPVWGATHYKLGQALRFKFQFTHPVWGATLSPQLAIKTSDVSIHAPRVGCDYHLKLITSRTRRFNSRTPCGVRLIVLVRSSMMCTFQFTHPVWGATRRPNITIQNNIRFNSRTPCGVRQAAARKAIELQVFQFTHPVWGATTVM